MVILQCIRMTTPVLEPGDIIMAHAMSRLPLIQKIIATGKNEACEFCWVMTDEYPDLEAALAETVSGFIAYPFAEYEEYEVEG